MAFLEWRDIAVEYGSARAIDGFSLDIDEGEILAVMGPSGSGKSTLLRVTAGLEAPTAGRVSLMERDLAGVPPHRRGFGLMFQDYCLFPHLSVERNIAFGLRMLKWSRRRRAARVGEMLKLVRLEGFGRRDVISLSGGEQQRVALARSLAPSPRLLMLDEPMGALDASLKSSLVPEMLEILRKVGVTVIYVTHDHEEAMTVAGRVALLDRGRLIQAGRPEQLVQAPRSAFVAGFLGLGAIWPGTWGTDHGAPRLLTDIGEIAVSPPHLASVEAPGASSWSVLVRPQAISFSPRLGALAVRGRLVSRRLRASGTTLILALSGKDGQERLLERTVTDADGPCTAPPDGQLSLWLDPAGCRALPG